MRSKLERRRQVEELLQGERDCWLATAQSDQAHLIPISFLWDGQQLIIATFRESVTMRNISRGGRARVALPSLNDVVLIDATVTTGDPADLSSEVAETFAEKTRFDATKTDSPFVMLYLTPTRILAWQDESELEGREIMRQGIWIEN